MGERWADIMERYIVRSEGGWYQVVDQRSNSPAFFPANLVDRTRSQREAENYADKLNRMVEARRTDRRVSERRSNERRASERGSGDRRAAERRHADRRAAGR